MKMLHPSLNTYQPLEVNTRIQRAEFLVSVEHGDTSILPVLADALTGFVPYSNHDGYYWDEDEVDMSYLGSGCFSTVFEHPTKEGRAIKLFKNYVEDSTCYQYLRLCANGTLDYEWCPNIYALGRIKIAVWVEKCQHWEFRECAYAEMDLLPFQCNDSAVYMGGNHSWWDTFKTEVKDVYFTYAGMDFKRDNVLGKRNDDGEVQYYVTDPVWNYNSNNYAPTHEPLKDLYVTPTSQRGSFYQ